MGGTRRRGGIFLLSLLGILTVSAFGFWESLESSVPIGFPESVSEEISASAKDSTSLQMLSPIEGTLQWTQDCMTLQLNPGQGQARFEMKLKIPYQGRLCLDHVEFLGLPIIGEIEFKAGDDPKKGVFSATHLLINYYPATLFSGQYEIRNERLFLSPLEVENFYTLSGSIGLKPPYELDLNIQMKPTPVQQLFFVSELANSGVISGTVKGDVSLQGPWDRVNIKGSIEAENGHLGKNQNLRFSYLFFHLEGNWPLLTVTDARLYREEGMLLATGQVDLSQLGKGNPIEKIKLYSDKETLFWKGWDIQTKRRSENEEKTFRVGKSINRGMRLSFKGFIDDEIEMQKAGADLKELELEYRFRGNKSIKMQIKGNEEFLGLENRVKF